MKRTCYKCKLVKSLEDFYKHTARKSGYEYICKDCQHMRQSKYRATRVAWNKSHKESVHKAIKNYILKFPEKDMARKLLKKAVENGSVKKENCSVCSNPKVHAHHPDYTKPLDVMWLCALHHQQLHFNRL